MKSEDFVSYDGVSLKTYRHTTNSDKMLIFTHGMSEYASRHDYLKNLFGEKYNILSYDVRGHGYSGYSRGYIRSFEQYERDLLHIINFYKEYKISLMGHSMGGLITLGCLERFQGQFSFEKILLSGPALGAGDKFAVFLQQKLQASTFKKIGKVLRHIPVGGSVDTSLLSHDPKVQKEYKADQIMLKKLKARMVMEVLARGNELMKKAIPSRDIIFVAGEKDQIVDIKKIYQYCDENKILDNYHLIPNALHEIHFEISPMKEEYFSIIKKTFGL